jgi:hypothetical protein
LNAQPKHAAAKAADPEAGIAVVSELTKPGIFRGLTGGASSNLKGEI